MQHLVSKFLRLEPNLALSVCIPYIAFSLSSYGTAVSMAPITADNLPEHY